MQDQDEKQIFVQLAELRQKMNSVNNSVDEIKSSVKELLSLDRIITELSTQYKQTLKDINAQSLKLEETKEDIITVNKKADEWINKAKGARFTFMLIGAFAQAVILGAIMYTFNHLRNAEDNILLINQRLNQVEQKHEKSP